jgi:hypothetical protein
VLSDCHLAGPNLALPTFYILTTATTCACYSAVFFVILHHTWVFRNSIFGHIYVAGSHTIHRYNCQHLGPFLSP